VSPTRNANLTLFVVPRTLFWLLEIYNVVNYCQLLSGISCIFQSSMMIFHNLNVRMHNISSCVLIN